jgi:hypothetical protein
VKTFFTKILILEITSRSGPIGWRKKYKAMIKEIRYAYGKLTYENYCKHIRIKDLQNKIF